MNHKTFLQSVCVSFESDDEKLKITPQHTVNKKIKHKNMLV